MVKELSGASWEFEEFRVMTEKRLLIAGDRVVPLTSKAFDTLLVLIENRDRVVTKDELLRFVWPDVEVEEGNLTQQIFLLRKALGETAQHPRHIVTIPGHGYRFTARVTQISSDPDAAALQPSGALASPPRRDATLTVTALATFGLATIGLIWMPLDKASPTDFTTYVTKITANGKASASAISRDGRLVAYVENDGDQYSLWLKQLGTEAKTTVIPRQPLEMLSPSFSPDGDYIYFGRRSPLGPMGVLYRVPTFGGVETPVLEDVDSPISFSPDGREFVFMRGTEEGPTIVVAAADGSSQHVLATRKAPLGFGFFAPDWSPDGKLVAAVVNDTSDETSAIVLLPLDKGSTRELYKTNLGIGRLRWLPDGSAVITVMSERLQRRVFGGVSAGAIWRIDYPNGRAQRLTADLANHDPCCLDIGANGSVVANISNSMVSDLWMASADRPDVLIKQVTSDHPVVARHSWLPDNDTIVYRDLTGRLYGAKRNGGTVRLQIPDGQEVTGGVSACGDGRYLVFSTMPAKNIWRVSPTAGAPRKLTNGVNDFNPSCSPDGKWVFYASRERDYVSLWRVSIEGGEPTPLNLTNSYDVLPSPTGRMILYQTDWVEEGADRNRPDRWEVISSSDMKRLFTFDAAGDRIGMMTKWAPDESGVDYIVTQGGVSNIWRQKLAGGPPLQITHLSVGRIFTFAWSPDGRWLSLGIGAYRSDVVLMSNQPR
ncbi:MAG TPA: LpqB family beta-propeller domain-containing protein [Vicinamibacterales bacterium]